ncbi:hypothetical protein [Nostoc sp. ChiVER01]|uniref:hypothetical protein n=1 Tax=Nostoc sp. ChiVER01 TaxID=3075382 RepID=UPI002AD47C3E|nr:hypothetical protein [Nostoc sp. ChiVER01]MDZ8226676.1 hypothetical protein [Nostoc sp. ChiVER01]
MTINYEKIRLWARGIVGDRSIKEITALKLAGDSNENIPFSISSIGGAGTLPLHLIKLIFDFQT